ncbi:hypothetical protein E2C01_011587 [Portunus trituberculatus]|uniref:Uncharacterized protein n=1 Tax=Portunus trituberculatus TaxID=210409 RepID=A0A5B7DBJ6_PORTR|nr:hypothetical protein [Portunus trituberculatus]
MLTVVGVGGVEAELGGCVPLHHLPLFYNRRWNHKPPEQTHAVSLWAEGLSARPYQSLFRLRETDGRLLTDTRALFWSTHGCQSGSGQRVTRAGRQIALDESV